MPLSPAARCITLSASSAALPLRFAVRHKMLEVTEPIFGHVGGSSIDEGSSGCGGGWGCVCDDARGCHVDEGHDNNLWPFT